MPSVKHFKCSRCGAKKTSPDGRGMPTAWTQLRVAETTGCGPKEFGSAMWNQVAKALFCGSCWPRDWRSSGARRQSIQKLLENAGGIA